MSLQDLKNPLIWNTVVNPTFIESCISTAGFVHSSGLTSTVTGIGSSGYISSLNSLVNYSALTSTVAGLGSAGYFSTQSLFSTSKGFVSSLVINELQFGDGTGMINFGPIQTIYNSSIQTNTSLLEVSVAARISTLTIGGAGLSTSMTVGTGLQVWHTGANNAIKATGTSWATFSDERIKQNIIDADYSRCYSDIKSLRLRRFDYNSTFTTIFDEPFDKNVLGFIAQEVKEVIPKATTQVNCLGISDLYTLNVEQVNMSLFGAVRQTIDDKEALQSTVQSIVERLSTIESYLDL